MTERHCSAHLTRRSDAMAKERIVARRQTVLKPRDRGQVQVLPGDRAASDRVPGPVVVVDRVSRRYPTGRGIVVALPDFSAWVARGELIAITGPSGSGKTTLLNLIAGLETPTSGEVHVLGKRIDSMSDGERTQFRARSIGLVFQEPRLLPSLTALENVAVARLPWEGGRELVRRSRRLLEAVGLGHRCDHLPSQLSGGEQQRVGLARALVGDPKLLIADEPTGNLDRSAAEALLALFETIRRDRGLTTIVATHDTIIARGADRAIVLPRRDAPTKDRQRA